MTHEHGGELTDRQEWLEHQRFELEWWTYSVDTFGEEAKQLDYARRMGLTALHDGGRWPVYDMGGRTVLDVGGGPASMLLKCRNLGEGSMVMDPCPYPAWVAARYEEAGIEYRQVAAEDETLGARHFDEAWIYNVLQHTMDPAGILRMMRQRADLVRVCEWVDIPPHEGHPHELKADALLEWLGGGGPDDHWATASIYLTLEEAWKGQRVHAGRAFAGYFAGERR